MMNSTTKLKVITIVGTRPEIIRLSRTMALLDQYTNHIIVHTRQNYDYELNEIFWTELELRKPDHFLNIDTSSLGSAVGDIIKKSEEVLILEQPDAILVLGDTNSCLSAYMAKRMHIPVFHMEAGNRCFDFNVPEELNRRIIDHIADFNLVYTEHARRHLISEGLPHRRIYLTGSPMREVLDYYKPKINASTILQKLNLLSRYEANDKRQKAQSIRHKESSNRQSAFGSQELPITNHQSPVTSHYFLVSVHREENVDNPENLKKILTILQLLTEKYKVPIIVSTHPRTRKRLEALISNGEEIKRTEKDVRGRGGEGATQLLNNSTTKQLNSLLQFHKPFGFLDYVHLQQNALCTISDSGTISEESAILSFPAISLRNSMERPEAQDAGTIILTGFDPGVVLNCIETTMDEHKHRKYDQNVPEYTITDTSWRVLKLILGNARLSNIWHGINSQK
jgi:UDP-N-acetylglucosamine 2-epimerase (non-hydrolysing)